MIAIKAKLKVRRGAYALDIRGRLELPFAARRKSGARAVLDSGEEVELRLPHGEVLRGGDLVTASDGRVIEVVAAAEKLAHAECASPAGLARLAYHLGERHAPLQLGDTFLRFPAEPALQELAQALGAKVSTLEAPFEGEALPGGGGSDDGHDHGHDHDHHHPHRH